MNFLSRAAEVLVFAGGRVCKSLGVMLSRLVCCLFLSHAIVASATKPPSRAPVGATMNDVARPEAVDAALDDAEYTTAARAAVADAVMDAVAAMTAATGNSSETARRRAKAEMLALWGVLLAEALEDAEGDAAEGGDGEADDAGTSSGEPTS